MINTILVLLWIASVLCIFYFWKKKPNRKYKWASVITCVVLFLAIGLLPENQAQSNKTTEVQKTSSSSANSSKAKSNSSIASSSSSTKKSSSSSATAKPSSSKEKQAPTRNKLQRFILKHKAEKLQLGTSMNEVEKKLGKPVRKDGQMLTYDDFYLNFENDKLIGSDLPAIQKKVSKKIKKEKQDKKDYQTRLQSFAQSFGTKPVEELQRMPSVYTSDHVEDNMVYTWHPDGLPMLIRVDSPGNFTTVYQYDRNGEHNALGKKLYEGRTIYQKQKAPVVYD